MAEIKRKDVDVLAGKLSNFARELPEHEKNVLDWILTRARSTSAELSEEELDTVAGGAGQSLAEALGFGDGDEDISVTWKLSF